MEEAIDPMEWVPNAPCYATRWVAKDGLPVGFMYRGTDDGWWVFTSGQETQEEMDDPANSGIYSMRTIAALDRAVLPFLDELPGHAYQRTPSGTFEETSFPLFPLE